MKLKCGVCKDGNLNACPWLLCRLCNKAIHKACDIKYLDIIGMKNLNKYLCPSCRNIQEDGNKEDVKKEKEKKEKVVEEEEESFVL